MAENMENKMIDAEVKEETAMATTQQPAETTEKAKTDYIGIAKTAVKVVLGVGTAALCFFAGVKKGKEKAAAKTSKEEDIVDAEPVSEEDEVSE